MKVYILKDYIDPEYRKLTPEQLEKDIQDEIEKSKELTEWPCPYNVPIVMDSLVGSIESDMGIKAT